MLEIPVWMAIEDCRAVESGGTLFCVDILLSHHSNAYVSLSKWPHTLMQYPLTFLASKYGFKLWRDTTLWEVVGLLGVITEQA